MSDGYYADLGEIGRLVDKAAEIDTKIEERLDAIDERVRAMQASWSGEASAAHKAAHDAWMHGAREMRDALGKLHKATKRAHTNYQNNAQVNQVMWPS